MTEKIIREFARHLAILCDELDKQGVNADQQSKIINAYTAIVLGMMMTMAGGVQQ